MTLNGLTVEEWLQRQSDTSEEISQTRHQPAHTTVEKTRPPRSGRARAIVIWCAAIATGAWIAAPVLGRHVSCPPAGEGATACHLHHHVLAATMTFLLVAAGVVLATRLLFALPAFVARARREGLLPRPPSATAYTDPILIAANRGHIV